jgi:hypothetical protein
MVNFFVICTVDDCTQKEENTLERANTLEHFNYVSRS